MTWMIFLLIVGFTGSIYAVSWLKKQFPAFNTYWNNGIVWGVLAVILIHMGIWWRWTGFWENWQSQSGFVFFQIVLALGLYFKSLKDRKFLRHVSLILIILGAVGISWNMMTAGRINATVEKVMSPEELKDLPSQNKKVEKKVTRFWKDNLPEEAALTMLRIVRRQSGFNQFGNDGKPYRNPKNNNKLGVMQIDDSKWSERATELDDNLDELDGNLKFALWLYRKEGFVPWGYSEERTDLLDSIKNLFSKSKGVDSGKVEFDVVVGQEWTKPVEIPANLWTIHEPDRLMWVRGDGVKTFIEGPDTNLKTERFDKLEFRIKEGEVEKGKVHFSFSSFPPAILYMKD